MYVGAPGHNSQHNNGHSSAGNTQLHLIDTKPHKRHAYTHTPTHKLTQTTQQTTPDTRAHKADGTTHARKPAQPPECRMQTYIHTNIHAVNSRVCVCVYMAHPDARQAEARTSTPSQHKYRNANNDTKAHTHTYRCQPVRALLCAPDVGSCVSERKCRAGAHLHTHRHTRTHTHTREFTEISKL